ncbi:SLC5/6 family protein [Ralstonia chuxiongensis]|uniref:hypothetical protein n=1 Tax=Ralstonia chuxiongensis TaxID=2957504 RepID=UPI0028F54F17|nr:hypothetical protein [Ralstonia chuxiongensis]CAJ0783753.1 hypothetical protein R8510_05171 [Ralstonia chuxiongensis]
MDRALSSMQVAALLISASYGIGFLFGSGEIALTHGMAGSIYGLATAVGMLLLTFFAARLWRGGRAVWDLFGQEYGPTMKHGVALLSIIWMAGVLAAQIHGGVAIMRLLGLGEWLAFAVVLGGVYIASRFNLGLASKVFALFLLGSGLVLLYVLLSGSGGQFYARGPILFAQDLSTFSIASLVSIIVAVVALVVTGADYHQFLFAARRPLDATLGCLLAAVALVALSFVPASVVLGLQQKGGLVGLEYGKQVIPFALTHAAADLGVAAMGKVFLMGLLGAALGSGAAILRAMTSALKTATHGRALGEGLWPSLLVLAIGAALAIRGQSIVDTMVSVNVIYIASIAITFGFMITGRPLPARGAMWVVLTGFAVSTAVYLLSLASLIGDNADLMSLLAGLCASGVVLAGVGVQLRTQSARKI